LFHQSPKQIPDRLRRRGYSWSFGSSLIGDSPWHDVCDDLPVRPWFPLLSVLAITALAQPLSAQCASNASSCVTCHETQGLRPVLDSAQIWHVDHGFGDLCASCHGGDPASPTKEEAHLGLRQPLADAANSCTGCHTDDSSKYAERYLRAAVSMAPPPHVTPPTTVPPKVTASPTANRVLISLAALLSVALFFAVLHARATESPPLLSCLRNKLW